MPSIGAQRHLRDVAHILSVDQDAAAGHVVEAEQQPRDRRLAGARRADDRDRLAGRHLEAHALEDRPRRLVGELDVVEADRALPDRNRLGVRLVHDLGRSLEDPEHGLDVDRRLLDLAIDHAHEIQRLVELDHHGVDHHEVADRVLAALNAERAHHHDGREAHREDRRLPGVEHGERGVGFHAGGFVALHRAVITPRLARLRREIFHRLVVEQRIDRLGVGVAVAFVHAAADADAPFRRGIGEPHVERDGDQDHRHVAPVELVQQHADDKGELDHGRRRLQDHHAHDGLDAVAAALQHARQPPGLALQMKAQRELVHVLEGDQRETAHRVHRDLGEHAVAQLREARHQDAHAAIGQRHRDRRGNRPGQPVVGSDRRSALPGQRIDRPFEGEGHRDGGELGEQQQHRRPDHAPFEVDAVGRPDIRPQPAQRLEQSAAVGRDLTSHRMRRSLMGVAHLQPGNWRAAGRGTVRTALI